MAVGGRLVENLGEEPGAERVLRVATGHPERDGAVAGDPMQEVDAAVDGRFGRGEVAVLEERARVGEGVDFERKALLEPRLEPRVVGLDRAGHDADRGAAVDRLEAVEDRAEERLVPGRVAHVVDRQDDHRVDPVLADPLRGRQLGEVEARRNRGRCRRGRRGGCRRAWRRRSGRTAVRAARKDRDRMGSAPRRDGQAGRARARGSRCSVPPRWQGATGRDTIGRSTSRARSIRPRAAERLDENHD